jgi:hypothetical protein
MRNASAGLSSDVDAASVRHRVRLLPRYLLLHVPIRLMQQMLGVVILNWPRKRATSLPTACRISDKAGFRYLMHIGFKANWHHRLPKNAEPPACAKVWSSRRERANSLNVTSHGPPRLLHNRCQSDLHAGRRTPGSKRSPRSSAAKRRHRSRSLAPTRHKLSCGVGGVLPQNFVLPSL